MLGSKVEVLVEAGETAHWVRVYVPYAEDIDSVSSTYIRWSTITFSSNFSGFYISSGH